MVVSDKVREALEAYEEFTDDQFWRYVNYSLGLSLSERQELARMLKALHPEIYG